MAPRAGGISAADSHIGLLDLWRILRRRVGLCLAVWMLVTASSAALTYYLRLYHPVYESYSRVLVRAPVAEGPLQFQTRTARGDLMDRYVADQRVLVEDPGTLDEVLRSPVVQATRWYQGIRDPTLRLERMQQDLRVAQIPGTNHLLVGFRANRPDEAAAIANVIVEKYLGRIEFMLRERYAGELGEYREREQELLQELRELRQRQLGFLESTVGVAGVALGLNVAGEAWQQFSAEAIQIEAQKLQYKAAYETLAGLDPEDIDISPTMRSMVDHDPFVFRLRNRLVDLGYQHRLLTDRLGPHHREVRGVEAQMDIVREKLSRLTDDLLHQVRLYEVDSAQTLFLNAAQSELLLRDKMLQAEETQRALDRNLTLFRAMEQDYLQREARLNEVRSYLHELDLHIRARRMIRIRQTSEATPARDPVFPRWGVFLPAGGVLGLICAIGLAVMLHVTNTSIRTPRDLPVHVHLPVLGVIPDPDDDEVVVGRLEQACAAAPRSAVAEAFRAMRVNVQLSSPGGRQRSLLVTSSQPEEGRTVVAVNLATAVAQSGRRVLLIDANLRRPGLQRVFLNGTHGSGLSQILVNRATLDEAVCATEIPNLFVLHAGASPPNPAELLGGPLFSDLMSEALRRYDDIIIDGPPVLLANDAVLLAEKVDGTILVCRAGVAERAVVVRACRELWRTSARIIGGVLNGARADPGGYFREQIREYHEYCVAGTPPVSAQGTASDRMLPPGRGDGAG